MALGYAEDRGGGIDCRLYVKQYEKELNDHVLKHMGCIFVNFQVGKIAILQIILC